MSRDYRMSSWHHEYLGIDEDILWDIVVHQVPQLLDKSETF